MGLSRPAWPKPHRTTTTPWFDYLIDNNTSNQDNHGHAAAKANSQGQN